MMKKIAWLLLSATMLLGCANAKQSTPALWKVSDADNSLYLLGSFHFLKADDYPMSASVQAAMLDAENLLFELSPQEMQSPEIGMAMLKAGMRSDGKSLNSELSPTTQKKLSAWVEKNRDGLTKLGISEAFLQGLEPWYAGMLVSVIEIQKNGLQANLGLDNHFMNEAKKTGKSSAGLELASEQIALFDTLSASVQREFLMESLHSSQDAPAELQRMHAAWRRGDVKYMWKEMALPMRKQYPALYARINTARNDAWLLKLQQILDTQSNDDSLVVVGTLHLLGKDGVVEKLRARGYRVERVQ